MNILLSVALGVLTALVSGLGGHLALTKPWHKWFFWMTGFLMLVIITVQTVRNERSQVQLQAQLDAIQKNTEQPPKVSIQNTVPPSQVILSDESKERERRKSVRQHLANFLPEADTLWACYKRHQEQDIWHEKINPPLTDEEWRSCQEEKKLFESKFERYLRANLDSSYVTRFKAQEGGPEDFIDTLLVYEFLKEFT